MAMSMMSIFENTIPQLTCKPSINIEPPPDLVNGLLNAEKVVLQEIVRKNCLTSLKTKSLPLLLVEGFDTEQIWQQLELQNSTAVSHLTNLSCNFLVNVSVGKSNIENDEISETGSLSDEYQDPLGKGDSDFLDNVSVGKSKIYEEVDSEDEDEDINMFKDIPSEDSDKEVDTEDEVEDEDINMFEDIPSEDSDKEVDSEDKSRNTKVKQQIEDYEQKLLKPAAWHLTGEVDAHKRPKDALLHLQTDFEMNAKPVVVQDKPLCEKLESILKNTIKNKAFSDGVRQYKTYDEIIAKKKEIVIEDTKSKKGLAQEYEDMYLKKKHGEEEQENPKHVEIKKLMDSLFPELHALFTHIPKPAVPDMKIVSNLPAISVEDVAPTSVSDVTLLAPEEVKKRTGVIKGQTERTDVDRKRERRKKKFLQKMQQKKREKEIGDKPLSAKAKKQEKLDLVKKLKQLRNTKFAKADGLKVKSSKDFFERLQETVNSTEGKNKSKKF